MTGEILNAELLNVLFWALSPLERWEAARSYDSGVVNKSWFIAAGFVALVILVAILFWVSYNRMLQQRKAADQIFFDQAEKRGLSARERQMLFQIVTFSGLKDSVAIFTLQNAFEQGAAKLIEQELTGQAGAEEAKQLRTEMSFLREKLGFQTPSSVGPVSTSRNLRSRQVPVGRSVQVTRRQAADFSGSIDAVVIENSDAEMSIKLAMSLQSKPGEYWRVRYSFGASVLEFDTTVIRCDDDILVLNHTDNVRFINRRRFLRVAVTKPALMALFPFERNLPQSVRAYQDSGAIPEFMPAVITELAGPGLRIETPLQVKVGDRVLVIFELNAPAESEPASKKPYKAAATRIAEDIGVVRHTRRVKDGLSVAVEMVGLSDSDISELIRATNAASASAEAQGSGNFERGGKKKTSRKQLAGPVAGQGN